MFLEAKEMNLRETVATKLVDQSYHHALFLNMHGGPEHCVGNKVVTVANTLECLLTIIEI